MHNIFKRSITDGSVGLHDSVDITVCRRSPGMRSRSRENLETHLRSRLGHLGQSLGLVSELRVSVLVLVSKEVAVSVSVLRLKVLRVSTNSLINLMINNKN